MRSVVSMPASEVIHSTGRRASGRSAVVTRANGIRTSGQHVVNIKSTWKKRYKIINADAIPVYNANAQDYLQNLDLPLGAQLVAVDTNTGAWQMQVPKLEFSDVFIKPTADINVATSTESVIVTTKQVSVEASEQIERMGLNERYDVDAIVSVKALQGRGNEVEAEALVDLKVDMPFPFNLTPKPIMEGMGSAVMSAMLGPLMDTFAKKMVQDMEGMKV